MPELDAVEELTVYTPYGAPSDTITAGVIGNTRLLFLPRHGRGHRIAPHEINYRANIHALKQLGASQVVSLSAVGSMKDDIVPGDVVIVDQYIDWTKRRITTFFEDGVVAHVGLADPVCPNLASAAAAAAQRAGGRVHQGGTYLCIDGPQFSTRAESLLYRSWGVAVIGMTAMPEAKLAREAELPYATVAFATDYDCWHTSKEAVSVGSILDVLQRNGELAQRLVADLAHSLPDPSQSPAVTALASAVMTERSQISPHVAARTAWLGVR